MAVDGGTTLAPSTPPIMPLFGPARLREPGREQLSMVGAPTAPDAPAAGPLLPGWVSLVDVAPALGIRFTRFSGASGRKHYCEPKGGGIALFDADGDGWPDLYVVDGGVLPGTAEGRTRSNRLFRNVGGERFEDITQRAGVAGGWYDMGAAVGDYDGDGHPDLFVTGVDSTLLYRNRGDGTFEEVTEKTGARVTGWTSAALFADLDEDGFLDLYVVRYVDYHPRRNSPCYAAGVHNYCTPHDFPTTSNVILRNEQGRHFKDVTPESLPKAYLGTGLMVVAGDLNLDGHQDLYVANDELPNFLFLGDGRLKFKENALLAGVAVGSTGFPGAGMGADLGDVDGDRLLDIVVGNFADQPVDYYRNNGNGTFSERSSEVGIYNPTYRPLEFGVKLVDLDLDGDLDLYVCHGHIWDTVATFQPGMDFPQQNTVLRNVKGQFEDVSGRSGPGQLIRRSSRGLAVADFDRDGDPDLAYLNQDSPAVLLRNDRQNQHQWLQLELIGLAPNTRAIGAQVEVWVDGSPPTSGGVPPQLRQVTAGGGYQSSSELVLQFGLGDRREASRILIRWPPPLRGTTELKQVPANQRLTVRQTRPPG